MERVGGDRPIRGCAGGGGDAPQPRQLVKKGIFRQDCIIAFTFSPDAAALRERARHPGMVQHFAAEVCRW